MILPFKKSRWSRIASPFKHLNRSTITTYPGVYIEEDASLSLSISHGNTAIPVFIGRFQPKKTSATPKAIRVSSWLDFTNLFNVGCITSIAITSTKPTPPPPTPPSGKVVGDTTVVATTNIALNAGDTSSGYNYAVAVGTYTTSSDAVKLYFQNGGGPCYILPVANPQDTATSSNRTETRLNTASIQSLRRR